MNTKMLLWSSRLSIALKRPGTGHGWYGAVPRNSGTRRIVCTATATVARLGGASATARNVAAAARKNATAWETPRNRGTGFSAVRASVTGAFELAGGAELLDDGARTRHAA